MPDQEYSKIEEKNYKCLNSLTKYYHVKSFCKFYTNARNEEPNLSQSYEHMIMLPSFKIQTFILSSSEMSFHREQFHLRNVSILRDVNIV